MPTIISERSANDRILIVGTQESQVQLLELILWTEGYQAIRCTLFTKQFYGIRHLFSPDLILLDWQAPGFRGREFLADIRQEAWFAATPIVLLSTDTSESFTSEVINLGATDVIAKPLRGSQLSEKVHQILRIRRLKFGIQ